MEGGGKKTAREGKVVSEYMVCSMEPLLLWGARQVAKKCLRESMAKTKMAEKVKKFLDSREKEERGWNCVVGTAFGGTITFEKDCGGCFFIGSIAVLIFR